MLQNQVLKTPRRRSRRPHDPRTAALAVAASAALVLTMPTPLAVHPLTAGLGGPPVSRPAVAPGAGAGAVVSKPKSATAPAPAAVPETAGAEDRTEAAVELVSVRPPREERQALPPSRSSGFHPARRSAALIASPTVREVAARRGLRAGPGGASRPAPAARSSPTRAPAERPRRRDSFAVPRAEPDAARGFRPSRERFVRASAALRSTVRRRPGAAFSSSGGSGGASARSGRTAPPRDSAKPRRKSSHRRRPRLERVQPDRRTKEERFHPVRLARLIGPRALRPPPAGLEPPATPADWARRRPVVDEAGRPLTGDVAGLEALDDVDPSRWRQDRRPGAHWDAGSWHDGNVRGAAPGGAWLRLERDGTRWWAFAAGGAQLRHDGVWWTKERGVWFVVHEGRVWAWRTFQDWDAQGLFQPDSGTELVYSRDFARVAVITPGEGAEVFDVETGGELARIPEGRMPARKRPHPPLEPRLPPDVFAEIAR